MKRRFSLSTLLLIVTIAGISIGWYFDRQNGRRPTENYLTRQLNLAVSNQIPANQIEWAIGISSERFGDKFTSGLKHAEGLKPDPQFPNMGFPVIGRTRDTNVSAYAVWPIIEKTDNDSSLRYIGICWPKDGSSSYVFRAIYISPFSLE